MKRFLSVMLAALLIWACMAANLSALAADYGYVKATGQLNVRTGPGLDYESIGIISKGKKLEYEGEKKKDERGVVWYRVVYKGDDDAWVSSKYAKLTNDSSSSGSSASSGSSKNKTVTTTGNVNLRSGPGLDYKKVDTVKSGVKLTYKDEISTDDRGVEWFKVEAPNGKSAWVSSKYASLKGYTPAPTKKPAATKKPKPTATPEPEYEEPEDNLFAEWEFEEIQQDSIFEPFTAISADANDGITKEEIQKSLGIANYNSLINIIGIRKAESGKSQSFRIDFADDVYYGGTDGYVADWMNLNGIIAEADVDMNGDGSEEYVVVYVNTEKVNQDGYEYLENEWRIAIYDPIGGAYVKGADFEIHPGNVNERCIRLVDIGSGKGILVGQIDYWDGMGGGVSGTVYGYGRFGASVESMFYTSSDSNTFVVHGASIKPENHDAVREACENYYWEKDGIAQYGLEKDVNFIYFGNGTSSMPYDYDKNIVKRENFIGVDMAKSILANYGVELDYSIYAMEGGESYEFSLQGGEKLLWMNEAFEDGGYDAYIDIEAITTLNHIY